MQIENNADLLGKMVSNRQLGLLSGMTDPTTSINNNRARLVIPDSENDARSILKDLIRQLYERFRRYDNSIVFFLQARGRLWNNANAQRKAANNANAQRYAAKVKDDEAMNLEMPLGSQKLLDEIRKIQHIIHMILVQYPGLMTQLPRGKYPHLTGTHPLGKAQWWDRYRTLAKRELNTNRLNLSNNKTSSSHSRLLNPLRLNVREQHGDSAVPSVAKRVNAKIDTKGGRAKLSLEAVKAPTGKRKWGSNTNMITLYHVISHPHKNYGVGDFIKTPANGGLYWHSDPGFLWKGRAYRQRPGPQAVLKMKIPYDQNKVHRSTTDHDTSLGTTFYTGNRERYYRVTEKRMMNNRENSRAAPIPEYTVVLYD